MKSAQVTVGTTAVIREEDMTAATARGACGIAFFMRAIRAASQGGIEIGFHAHGAQASAAQTAKGAARRFPSQVLELFETALQLRDEHRQGRRTDDDMAAFYLGLLRELERLVQVKRRNSVNQRLARHLSRHLREWFWFLLEPHDRCHELPS